MFFKKTTYLFVFICFMAVSAITFYPFSLAYGVDTEDSVKNDSEYLDNELIREARVDMKPDHGKLTLPSVGEVIFKMVIFLGIVLLLIFGVSICFQKIFKGTLSDQNTHQDVIRVLSYRKFDMKRGIYLVDVLGKVLVIGSDIDGLNLITEISDPSQVEEARKMTDIKPDLFVFNPFQNVLDGFTKQGKDESSRQRRRDRESKSLIQKINKLKNSLDQ